MTVSGEYNPKRVNARFRGIAEQQLRYIVEHTGMNVSEVLKQSVAEMHERLRAERATPFEAVRSLGLVGAYAGGDPDASSRVKETVAATVAKKARPLKRQ